MIIGFLNPIIAMEVPNKQNKSYQNSQNTSEVDTSTVRENFVQEEEGEATKDIQKASIYVIPPLGGFYDKNHHKYYMMTAIGGSNIKTIIPVEDPFVLCADLGQSNCIKGVRKTFVEHKLDNAIIYAQSQGGATALNYLADEGRDSQIKALVLEAPVVSGNSAIMHTLKCMGFLSLINRIPFSYYWMPYCAKLLFHRYWPAGKQPIKVTNNIPTNIPIIIIHSRNDPQVPYHDGCALYHALRAQGNNNVYFITINSDWHIDMLSEGERPIIQAILRKHNLIENIKKLSKKKKINLDEYQPDHSQYKELYNELVRKERNHQRIGYGLIAGTAFLSCAVLYKIYQKFAA